MTPIKGIITITILLFLSICCNDTFGQGNPDSLLHIIGQNNVDSLILSLSSKKGVDRYETLSRITTFFLFHDADKAVKFAEEALRIAIELKDDQKIALTYGNLGDGEYRRNNYRAALKYLEIAEEIETKLNDDFAIARMKNRKAIVYTAMKRFDIALDLLNQVMAFNYEKGLKESYTFTLFNIANILIEKKEYDKALEDYLKVLDLNKTAKVPNKELTAAINANIGEVYYYKEKYDLSYNFRKKALDIYKEINFKTEIASEEMDIGLSLMKLKDYELSMQYLNLAFEVSNSINYSDGIRTVYEDFTLLYLETNRYPAALKTCNELERLCILEKDSSRLVRCYKMYADIYYNTSNYKASAEYYKKHDELGEIIDSRENKQKFLELESAYITEEKVYENKVLRKENELQKEKLNARQNIIVAVAVGVIISLVLIILLIISAKKIRKQNQKLEEYIVSLDKFFSIISHDLKSPFLGFAGLTGMMAENIDNFSKEELSEVSKEMHQNVNTLLRMLTNLLDWARMKQGAMSYTPAKICLTKKVSENLNLINKIIEQKGIEIFNEIPKGLFVNADQEMLNSILRNLLTNAVKFTSKKGKVNVKAKETVNNFVEIGITDSGIGISEVLIKKLFRIEEKVGRKGTEGEESTGLGLLLCKEFVEKQGGKIWVESKEGVGSTFYFTLRKAS